MGCSDDGGSFAPAGRYTPGLLDFGEIPTSSVRTMAIEVVSEGGGPLRVVGVTLEGDATKWSFAVDDALTEGLAPGQKANIQVTVTPCPEMPRDPTTCDTGPFSGTLVITDDSAEAGARIELAAVAVLPARASVRCPREDNGLACNRPDATADRCTRLDFGSDWDNASCGLFVDVDAMPRNGATGALEILEARILVRDLDDASGTLVDGTELGFTIDATPFEVPVDGTVRLNLATVLPLRDGTWVGVPAEGGGLRIRTNDPAQPEIAIPIFATSVPPFFSGGTGPFAPEARRQTNTLSARNIGGPAVITSIEIEPAEFTWSSASSPLGPIGRGLDREDVELEITYDPGDTVERSGRLRFFEDANVIAEFVLDVGRTGAVPVCRASMDRLTYSTAGERATATVLLESTGFGDCILEQLDITGPGDVDDFAVEMPACAALPCSPGIRVPTGQTVALTIAYENDDASARDTAQLEITTNDPRNPVELVILDAMDDACLAPTPVIMRTSEDPCVGQPIALSAEASLPGGRSTGATIVTYDWVVRFGEQIVFVPPNTPMTSFTPANDGEVIVGLEIENSCGVRSTAAAIEIIRVAQNCP